MNEDTRFDVDPYFDQIMTPYFESLEAERYERLLANED